MELFGLLAAVLGVVVSAVSTFANNTANQQNAQNMLNQQQNFASEQAEIANERYLSNWAETQSPQSQVQNFKDAGLSVGLMYGGANAGGGLSSAPMAASPSQQAPVMNPLLGNGLNDLFDNLLKISQKQNTDKDTDKKQNEIEEIKKEIEVADWDIKKIESEIGVNVAEKTNKEFQNKLLEIQVKYAEANEIEKLKLAMKEVELMEENIKKIGVDIEIANIDKEYKPKLYDKELEKKDAEIKLLIQEKVTSQTQAMLNKAEAYLKKKQGRLTDYQVHEVDEKIKQLKNQNKILEVKARHYQNHEILMEIKDVLGTAAELGALIGLAI